jgi:hypothetical protein
MRVHVFLGIVTFVAASAAFGQGRERSGAVFDRADANGDRVITRDEFMKARADQFATRDRNSDGFVDATDLGERAAGRQRVTQAMTAMIGQLDADQDGKVSKAEFVDGGSKLFDRADTDKSNSLDVKEVEAAKAALREHASR